MSLRDTLDAARQEVQDGGTVFSGKGRTEAKEASDGAEAAPRRARGSAANAKPARDAATSVRVVSSSGKKKSSLGKPRSEMSKEERKAARQAEQRQLDKETAARTALLNSYPGYKRSQKIWWIMLGTGLGLTIVAFLVNYFLTSRLSQEQGVTPLVVAAIAPLVLAYGCIIVAVIYDIRVARPMRKRAETEVNGMSVKRMNALIREDAKREEAEKAAKRAKKEARGR